VVTPKGFRINPFLTMTSGRPYNITIGKDLNGDGLFTDRPAFATDLSRSSVVRTAQGVFDLAPVPGATIIPRNFGEGPGTVAANLRVAKTFTFGGGQIEEGFRSKADHHFRDRPQRAESSNFATPVGNLSSPVFGNSSSLLAGQGVVGTRRIDLQLRFTF